MTGLNRYSGKWIDVITKGMSDHGEKVERYYELCGDLEDCKTSQFDRIGSGGTPLKSEEDRLIELVDKINKLEKVLKRNMVMIRMPITAHMFMTEIQNSILSYLNHSKLSRLGIAKELKISRTTFYRELPKIDEALQKAIKFMYERGELLDDSEGYPIINKKYDEEKYLKWKS